MAKALVTRQELALIALREIRSFPGGEHVTSVEVDSQIDRTAKTNWTLHVFITEGADMPRIQFAITTTRKRLRHRYDLRSEALQRRQDGLPPLPDTRSD
jgi:predicted membrane-bound spermidine synthase